MSLATSPSLPCCNLVYAMLRHISIKVQNRTGYTRWSWIHLLCEHFPRNSQKNNWFEQELRNLYKFKVFIMNQSTTTISRTAGQCVPRPTRWCRWVPHIVGKRASAFGGKHQRCPHRIPSSCAHPKAADILAPVAKAHKHVTSHRMALDSPTRRDAFYTCGCGCGIVKQVPHCPWVVHSVVHSRSCFFWILNENYKHVKICHLYSKSGVFFLNS